LYTFCFLKKQNSVRPVSPLRKKSFFSKQTRNFFFLTSSFYHRIHFIKKEIYHEMQREKLYNLQRTVYFNCVRFVFKILCDQFSPLRKLIAQNFAFFKNKKYTIKINCSLSIVELFTLHLVEYFFFNKTY